jgi:Cu-Zn family superoxide dismutase
MILLKSMAVVAGLSIASLALADTATVNLYKTAKDGERGDSVGTITLTDTQYGVLITPNLKNLTPGWHGFHLHVNPSCANGGEAAGPHFDPKPTNKHLGPYNTSGHLGDLPALSVQDDGTDNQPVTAPRLTVTELKGHSLMIHAGGDNYSDAPMPLGGGGARIACGIVK